VECWSIVDELSQLQQHTKEDIMILVRFVCRAKFGNANEVVAGFKQTQEIIRPVVGQNMRVRILTDLSGPFDTVIQEIELESLAEWERLRVVIFSNPEVQAAEAAAPGIIESGRTEFYTIEETWR
jgi:hypothetical protein